MFDGTRMTRIRRMAADSFVFTAARVVVPFPVGAETRVRPYGFTSVTVKSTVPGRMSWLGLRVMGVNV